jgi:hypothetical protein
MSSKGQGIIAGSSMLGGLALIALVFSIQHDPLAWTSAADRALSIPAPTTSPKRSPLSQPLESNSSPGPSGIVELPPVRITASSKSAGRPEKKQESKAWQPCSEWRELGPAYVHEGAPQGTRHVRNLC